MKHLTSQETIRQFTGVRIGYSRAGRRAPHKPLLLIWSISRCLSGKRRLAPYTTVEEALQALMARFGPHSGERNAHIPFWRLRTDGGIWEIDRSHLVRETSSRDPLISSLREHDIHGGLATEYYDRLAADPALAFEIVMALLHAHFPETLHQDILDAVEITDALNLLGDSTDRYGVIKLRQGQAAFRSNVLKAYQSQCAVCGMSVRVDGSVVAIEAAHIRWHSSQGPADVPNGLALCALHHKFFDYGAFTVLPDYRVFKSGAAVGSGVDKSLGLYHDSALLALPDELDARPDEAYMEWHRREVFRTPQEIAGVR